MDQIKKAASGRKGQQQMTCKAVIFDYIGTLVNCRGYSMADSENNLYNSLVSCGLRYGKTEFSGCLQLRP